MTMTPALPRVARRAIAAGALLALAAAATACSDDGVEPRATATSSTSTSTSSVTSTAPPEERSSATIDELVAIGSGRLHVRCTGSGDTTVLLLAGWNGGAEAWHAVEPTLAAHSRVCAYDRFGTGTSDAPSAPQTFERQAADLHELLEAIGEPGPYVVVGHSFGGVEAVLFAAAHPDEVAGLVLVDASPATWPAVVCSVPAYAGGCEMMRDPSGNPERLDVFPAFEQAAMVTSLDDVPMTVITDAHRAPDGLTSAEQARLDSTWADGSQRWADLSTAGRVLTVEETSHDIQLDHPTLVADEVLQLVP